MPARGKGPLRIALEDFAETSTFWGHIGAWINKAIEWVEGSIRRAFAKFVDKFLIRVEIDPETRADVLAILAGEEQGGITALAGFGANLGMSAASGLMAPLMRELNYAIDRKRRTGRMDPSAAIATAWRSPEHAEELIEGLRDLGWTDDLILAWTVVLSPVIGPSDLLRLWLRHERDDGVLVDELKKQGWSTERINILKELSDVIPSLTDLISMAVREAWRDDVARRFGYDEDFPTEVVEWAEKQGLSQEWVQRYWRAHWVLPGVTQAFDMLHRLRPGTTDKPFTIDDMKTLLRTADIPAAFRDWLVAISYSPYTRVDVRRMWRMGVLSEDEVKASYLDLGYDEEHADKLTQYTIWEETTEDRQLTRDAIVRGYKKLVMTRTEAGNNLVDIGYRPEDAELFLSIADLEIVEDKTGERIERARFLYVEGELNEQGVYADLGDLDLPSEQIADLVYRWEIERLKKVALPTKSELEELYERDIITLDDLKVGLTKRRYTDETIAWYTIRLDQEIAEKAAKEAERAQKEQERILKAEYATAYQKIKAGMDVEIAAIRLEMADIKLAMNYMVDPKDIDTAKIALDALRRDIADLQLGKAEIKVEYLGGPEGEE